MEDLFSRAEALYEARVRGLEPPLSEFEPLQYCDYAHWQRRALAPTGQHMAGPQFVENAAGRAAPSSFRLSGPHRLRKPIRRSGSSGGEPALRRRVGSRACSAPGRFLFRGETAAFAATLSGETGQDDLVLGTYVTNRRRFEFQNMIGFFANLATLRLRCDRNALFAAWVSALRRR